MRKIHFCQDKLFIRAVLSIDNSYNEIAYDDSVDVLKYEPSGVHLILTYNDTLAGIIILNPLNNVMWQPHIIIFKRFRGEGSEQWGKLAAEFMKERFNAKKFLALTPYENAKNYAERMGFSLIGNLSASIKKNGKLLDQFVLEL